MSEDDDTSPLTRDIAPFGLRMPPMLKERIKRAASDSGRSMNAEIVATLEKEYPEDVYSAEEFVGYLQTLAEPMDLDSQTIHAETLNAMFEHMGVDLTADLVLGDIIIMRKSQLK